MNALCCKSFGKFRKTHNWRWLINWLLISRTYPVRFKEFNAMFDSCIKRLKQEGKKEDYGGGLFGGMFEQERKSWFCNIFLLLFYQWTLFLQEPELFTNMSPEQVANQTRTGSFIKAFSMATGHRVRNAGTDTPSELWEWQAHKDIESQKEHPKIIDWLFLSEKEMNKYWQGFLHRDFGQCYRFEPGMWRLTALFCCLT
jgi:hypothetical protein